MTNLSHPRLKHVESLFDSTCFQHSLLPWLPDETLFSLCSRHHRLWGHATSGRSAQVLFGQARRGTQHDLPNSLDTFAERTHGEFGSPDLIASEHTLLKFYRPFLPIEVFNDAIAMMRGPSVAHLKFRLGLLTSRFRANHPLKACLSCMETDASKWGWSYWHLSHQYPGVWTCLEHREPLYASKVKSTGVERFLWQIPHVDMLSCNDARDVGAEHMLHRLARMVSGIASATCEVGTFLPQSMQRTIRARVAEKGWVTSSGNIRLKDAAADYLVHCKKLRIVDELSDLACESEEALKQVGRLLRPLRSGTHPLRLLVAACWLFERPEEFIRYHDAVSANSNHQRRSCIQRSPMIDDDRKVDTEAKLLALLSDGMSVTAAANEVNISVATAMAWATRANIEVKRRPKYVDVSLRTRIIDELRNGMDRREVATRHGVSVPTVSRVLQTEIGLYETWSEVRLATARVDARNSWTELLENYSDVGVKLMRSMNPAVYAWLYRNDRLWLNTHLPSKQSKLSGQRMSSVRWDVRDDELSLAVKRAAYSLVHEQGLRSLKLWQLYQVVPELKAKLSRLHRLPLTRQVLEAVLNKSFKKSNKQSLSYRCE